MHESARKTRTGYRQTFPEEFVELEQWFDAERNRKWNRQIEEDAQSGKLREVYEKLKSETRVCRASVRSFPRS